MDPNSTTGARRCPSPPTWASFLQQTHNIRPMRRAILNQISKSTDRIYQALHQLSVMPSTGTPRGRKTPSCPATPSKSKSIHETVIYPPITVTAANNPCLDKSLSLEHVLACGHLILTAEPNEPCAPNCHDASVTGAQCVGTKKRKIETSTATGQPFYCDACVETRFEALIAAGATAKQAGTRLLV